MSFVLLKGTEFAISRGLYLESVMSDSQRFSLKIYLIKYESDISMFLTLKSFSTKVRNIEEKQNKQKLKTFQVEEDVFCHVINQRMVQGYRYESDMLPLLMEVYLKIQ